ncbi:MAG: hypothetical protein CMB64_05425 [Euryarchaeota archaeon]|nr:hypothetical protein [Euryarchaeota archaeon]
MSEQSLSIIGVISAVILITSFSASFLIQEEEIEFTIDNNSIMNDIDALVSFGPRVTGSSAELEAAEYISQRFNEIGLTNIEIKDYEITGTWFEDAPPDEHQILMHAQLEQGTPNAPLLPDGTAGTTRVQLESTGELTHNEGAFSFLGYSGSNHKHDNILTFLGSGSEEDFNSKGDLNDLAVIINYDGNRTLAEIYKDAIDNNAPVLMIYSEGVEDPPFRSVTVQENNKTVPFPEAFNGEYSDLLIPYIYISESTANLFHEYIEEAENDDTKYAILDGYWEGSMVGTRTVKVVTGEITGTSDEEIMIGAHHDSVYLGPGAVDNAIGVSQLLEIASQLNKLELRPTIKFATWGGEELGLLGSQAFIEQSSQDLENLELYINLDSTNLDPSKGLGTLGIETTSKSIVKNLQSASDEVIDETKIGYSSEINTINGGGNSDHRSFIQAGIESIGLYGWKYPEYHLPTDTANVINSDGATIAPEIILNFIITETNYNNEGPLFQISGLEGESSSWVFPFMLALCAGLATGIGGLIVFFMKEITPELMAFLLAMAAGVMLLISIVDLWLGHAFSDTNKDGLIDDFLFITLSFLIGVCTVYLANYFLSRGEEDSNLTEQKRLYKSGILTAVALAIHNFPEGLAMGVAVLDDLQYGVVLMVAIALHNIPEGVAVAAPIQAGDGGRLKATMIAMLTGLTEPLGAIFALLILDSILTDFMVACSLAFVGGIMTVVSFRELIPQAMKQNRPRHMIVGMLFGAAVMQLSLLLLS